MFSSMPRIEELYTSPGFKSAVWKYFGFRKKGGRPVRSHVVCRKCLREVKYCGNTTNLAAHLKTKHGFNPVSRTPTEGTVTEQNLNVDPNRPEDAPAGGSPKPVSNCSSNFVNDGDMLTLLPLTTTVAADHTDIMKIVVGGEDMSACSMQDQELVSPTQERKGSGRGPVDHSCKQEEEEDIQTLYRTYLRTEIRGREQEMKYRAVKLQAVEQDMRFRELSIVKLEKEIQLLDRQLGDHQ